MVRVDANTLCREAHGADEARLTTDDLDDTLWSREVQWVGDAGEFLCLDGVEFMVAAEAQRYQAAVISIHHQRFQHLISATAQEGGERVDGLRARRFHFDQCFGGRGARCRGCHGLGFLDVRGISVAVGEGDGVFT